MKKRDKGILITLEGNEGCGKSTQIKLLYEALRAERQNVFLTREPGGTAISDAIRTILLDNKNKGMSGITETLLYMASRAQLVKDVIAPKIEEGAIVLCDRWLDATIAYQGFGEGVDVKWIRSLGEVATSGIEPKLTLFLDLPLEIGLKRAMSHKKADRMEKKKLAFHRKVREGYLYLVKEEPARFKRLVIGEKDTMLTVHEHIKHMVRNVL